MKNQSLEDQIQQERECLLRFANSLVPDEDLASKLVEDTIIRAENSAKEYKDCTSLRGWLFILMKEALSDQQQAQKRF
jgi:DNA-directed RNA polymerase specialized sigma24 family protein